MNASQIVRLNRYQSIIEFIEENPEILVDFHDFELSFMFFKSKIFDILEVLRKENQMTYEIIFKREETKKKICKAGADIEILLKTITFNESSLEVAARSKAVYDELFQKKDRFLLNHLQAIQEEAKKNLSGLARYGITLNLLNEYETMVSNYFHEILPAKKRITNKHSKLQLKNLFRQTEAVLKEGLDKNAKALKASHPDFFAKYKLLRSQKN
ncbi:hypothetical protein [uncultured Flavobacterium sp.]|uniref:hypothetical protein n=1 Tax=uncultured Flavobacterium sp. TaxID=165435 RepID=UPI0025CCAC46|nr:hypothetical protein [uncultured Flavobacterium sp.]